MYALYALFFLGAFFFVAFVGIFAIGALIGMARTASEALQAMAGKRSVRAKARTPEAGVAELPAHPAATRRAPPAEIGVEVGAACATA